MTYLYAALLFAGSLVALSRPHAVAHLAPWQPPPRLIRSARSIAVVLLTVSLFDELGLLLEEWSRPSGLLGRLRWLEGLPGFSHLLYIANLILVVPATLEVLNEHAPAERGPFSRRREMGVALALQFISLSLLLTGVQLLVWQEAGPGPRGLAISVGIVGCFALTAIACSTTVGHLQKLREGELEPLERLHQWDVWLILFGAVLLQTMITKAGLLLVMIPRCRDVILRALRRLLPRRPLPVGVGDAATMESLVHRLRHGDAIRRFGFYLLFTSGLPALFFWQSHASAFAPADSAFPRTQTINLLYTLDILLLAGALMARRRHAVIWASLSLLFSRHCLYIVTPSWFTPALEPPGFSPVDALASLLGSALAAPLFSFGVHLGFMALFWTQVQCLTLAQAAVVERQEHRLPSLFRWCLIQELTAYILPLFVAGTLVCVVISVDVQLGRATGEAAAQVVAQRTFVHAVGAGGLLIFCLLNLGMEWQVYRSGRSQPDQLHADLQRRWGQEGVARLLALHPAAAHYGKHRQAGGVDRLWVLHGGVAVAHLVAAGVVLISA